MRSPLLKSRSSGVSRVPLEQVVVSLSVTSALAEGEADASVLDSTSALADGEADASALSDSEVDPVPARSPAGNTPRRTQPPTRTTASTPPITRPRRRFADLSPPVRAAGFMPVSPSDATSETPLSRKPRFRPREAFASDGYGCTWTDSATNVNYKLGCHHREVTGG